MSHNGNVRSINANYIGQRDDQIKIVLLNVQNLIHHIEDVKFHHILMDHNLIVLTETWLSDVLTSRRKSVKVLIIWKLPFQPT